MTPNDYGHADRQERATARDLNTETTDWAGETYDPRHDPDVNRGQIV